MTLKINARELGGPITGIPRYAKNIIKHLEFLGLPCETIAPSRRLLGLRGALWEQFCLPWHLNKDDLLWSPSCKGPFCHKKQVVTVHDLVMYDHKELHPTSKMGKLWNFYYPKFWSQVLTVITVSNYTKQRLMEVCHIPETKIRVIYEAAEEHFRPVTQEAKEATKKKYDLSKEQYILSVAALNPRKNLGTLIKAWDVLRPQLGGQVNLVLVGMLYFNTSLAQLGLDNLPEDVILTGHVDDCDLPALYAGASAFVYPSLYEGFGLPPLEAMACGTPVVVSNVSSLPEVCGEAVVYIDPYSVDSLAEGILSVLTDRALSSHLSEKGLARVAEFSWERAAKEHLACFKEFM